jgi:hypothetical protein
MTKQLHLIGWLQLLAQVLIFKWYHSKELFKIHVYGWGGGKKQISMSDSDSGPNEGPCWRCS